MHNYKISHKVIQNISCNIDKYISLKDEELLVLIQRDENNAFKFLFKKYYSKLYGYALRFVSNEEIAEDILQEVFITFWEKRNVLNSISISSLLFCMVRNACLNYLKHKALVENLSIEYLSDINGEERLFMTDFALSADEQTLYEELKIQIKNVISILPDRAREVFLLSRFNGLKNREIAEKLNISTTAVEKHISNSLKKISAYLKDNVSYEEYIIILSFFISIKQ